MSRTAGIFGDWGDVYVKDTYYGSAGDLVEVLLDLEELDGYNFWVGRYLGAARGNGL
jgi:hypothetical protein